jgi:hypothetical protein
MLSSRRAQKARAGSSAAWFPKGNIGRTAASKSAFSIQIVEIVQIAMPAAGELAEDSQEQRRHGFLLGDQPFVAVR